MTAKIGTLTFILILMCSAAAFAGEPQTFVGTWVTTVTPPVEAGVPPFTLIFTFHADGNLLATGTGGAFPALGNPCHGAWAKSGSSIEASYVCLDFDATLQQTGMDRLRAIFTLDDKQQLGGQIGLTNYDVSGLLVFDACCADVTGQRVVVDHTPVVPTAHSDKSLRWRR